MNDETLTNKPYRIFLNISDYTVLKEVEPTP